MRYLLFYCSHGVLTHLLTFIATSIRYHTVHQTSLFLSRLLLFLLSNLQPSLHGDCLGIDLSAEHHSHITQIGSSIPVLALFYSFCVCAYISCFFMHVFFYLFPLDPSVFVLLLFKSPGLTIPTTGSSLSLLLLTASSLKHIFLLLYLVKFYFILDIFY